VRVFVFIRQESFAKHNMVEIAHAMKRLGWQIHWADIDELTKEESSQDAG